MPTYDYQCRSCGTVTEVIHPMSEDGPSVCDQCGGQLRRVLFPAGIIFKGSGFYRTDSRASPSSSSGGGTTGSSSTTKTDGAATTTSTSDAKSGSSDASAAPSTSSASSGSTSAE